MSKFSEALAEYKRKHQFTLDELAERLDSDPASVSRWVNGDREPKVGTIVAVSEALGIPVSRLL